MNDTHLCTATKEYQNYCQSELSKRIINIFGVEKCSNNYILNEVPISLNGIQLITGYSGSGKSTLLKIIKDLVQGQHSELNFDFDNSCAVIDSFPEISNFSEKIQYLSKFGLSEPLLMASRPNILSEGQRYRFALALLMIKKPKYLIADEFLSCLDRNTAKIIAYNFSKICFKFDIKGAFLATAHDDLIEYLNPSHHTILNLNGSYEVVKYTHKKNEKIFNFNEFYSKNGNFNDYKKLSQYHYRQSVDLTIPWDTILQQVKKVVYQKETVAVRVFCTPFSKILEKIPLIKKLNESILVSERIVVHPAFRSINLTSKLEPDVTNAHKVICSATALGKYFPFYLKYGYTSCGNINENLDKDELKLAKIIGLDLEIFKKNLYEKDSAIKEIRKKDKIEIDKVLYIARNIYVKKSINYLNYLCKISGLNVSDTEIEQIKNISQIIFDKKSDKFFEILIEEVLPYEMHYFYKKLKDIN